MGGTSMLEEDFNFDDDDDELEDLEAFLNNM